MEPAPSALALRPLSPMEYGVWKTDLGASLNFTTTARVSGPLTEQCLCDALPAVRARHAHLRARIVAQRPGVAVFKHDEVPPLALRVVRGAGASWVTELEREINEPIIAASGPLARFTLVEQGPDERWVLITLHHSVGDGMSGVFLMRDWIQAAAQALAGQSPELPALAEASSVDASLTASATRIRGWSSYARYLWRELWVRLLHGKPVGVRRDRELFAHSRRARVIPIELEASLAQRLAARARAENTTIHGALSAAMLLGLMRDAGLAKASVTFGTPVNVRALLKPAVGEQLGFYIAMVVFRDAVDAQTPFWDLARIIRRRIEVGVERGDQLAILGLLPVMHRLLGSERLSARALIERWERIAPTTSGLTNLGRLGIETRHGPLTIEACHFAAAPSSLGDFLASATSLGGKIFWNFIWPDPVLTEAHAAALVEEIVGRVRQSVE